MLLKIFLWGDNNIILSHEHTKMAWLTYTEAQDKLKWDSNKNVLWELNWKLVNGKTKL